MAVVLFILYLSCEKVFKWDLFTDASARCPVVGEGLPLCVL